MIITIVKKLKHKFNQLLGQIAAGSLDEKDK
jgi:hypothetical protein